MKLVRKTATAVILFSSLCLSSGRLLAAEKATVQARAAATQSVEFDIFLPLQHRDQLESLLADLHDPKSASYQHWLTPEQFEARFGTSDTQVDAIISELATQHLTATRESTRHIVVTGTAADVEQAFKTVLKNGTFPNGKTTVVATKPLTLPGSVTQAGAVVDGLSGMIRMRAHSHPVVKSAQPDNRYSATGGYFFDDLKQAYSYPSYQSLNGKGVTVGILMSGGYNPPDMAAYFGHEKLAVPDFSEVDVKGGSPYDPNNPDNSDETHLDMQQSGGMAPKAHIILYNLPDLSDRHIMRGLERILKQNKTDVVSMSFGGSELFYTAAYNDGTDFTVLLQAEDDLYAQGNAQGISFVASSGDAGALDAFPVDCFSGVANCGAAEASVDFPASSPHVTGVGGTNLVTTYTGSTTNLNSAYVRESAYADPLAVDIFYGTSATGMVWGSGGGNSIIFKKPLFQELTDTGSPRYRTVPDVSLHMGGCPGGTISCGPDDSFDWTAIGGEYVGLIGTSASAPDFAGLAALTVQRYGTRLGNLDYYIYTLALAQDLLGAKVFRTGIPGNNGLYTSGNKGYNRVLGVGTVEGRNFLLAPLVPVAGIPQTPSNP
jgi:kumamolisin